MRKQILTLALFLSSSMAFAQLGEQRNNLSVGINGGSLFSTVSFVSSVNQSTKQGLSGGFTARYISEKYFSMICGLQVELNYSQYGWKENFKVAGATTVDPRAFSRTLNYIEVPFLAHLAFGWDNGFQGFVNAGPQVGYMISESSKANADYINALPDLYNNYTNGEKASIENINSKFDYGIAVGGGMEWHTRKVGSFILEGRYYFGLADFFDSRKGASFERSAHRVIGLKATYLFDITK